MWRFGRANTARAALPYRPNAGRSLGSSSSGNDKNGRRYPFSEKALLRRTARVTANISRSFRGWANGARIGVAFFFAVVCSKYEATN